jgi:hypothetical protein
MGHIPHIADFVGELDQFGAVGNQRGVLDL